MRIDQKPDFYALLESLGGYLRQTRDVRKALRHAVRATRDHFGASEGCVAVRHPGIDEAQLAVAIPDGPAWDRARLAAFIRLEHPDVPHDHLVAPLRRRGRNWGVLALRRPGAPFEKGAGRLLCRLASAVSEAIEMHDRERMLEVRARIDRKIMEELRPKDLFYQILHGLRSLTGYDHSSALLIHENDDDSLTLVAEQIAWTKAKSRRIGMRLPVSADLLGVMGTGAVFGFDRHEDRWEGWSAGSPAGPSALARLLDFNRGEKGPAAVREESMLCAPLTTREGTLGVLKIAARHRGTFGAWDAALVEGFRYQAAVAIHNSRRTESLHARVVEAQRRSAMADLARGVSHDINNALGAVVPLVQQLQADAAEGPLDAPVLRRDLDQIHESLQLCRRIFGGMLALARGAAKQGSQGDVRRAVDATLAILKDGFDRKGVRLDVQVAGGLPPVAGGQSDLDQVLLNLLANARDATRPGDSVSVRARSSSGRTHLEVSDTGVGIPEEILPRIQEPFFTTKEQGSGLGLSICRSILWQMNGSMTIDSAPGRGTTVRVILPEAATGASGTRNGEEPR